MNELDEHADEFLKLKVFSSTHLWSFVKLSFNSWSHARISHLFLKELYYQHIVIVKLISLDFLVNFDELLKTWPSFFITNSIPNFFRHTQLFKFFFHRIMCYTRKNWFQFHKSYLQSVLNRASKNKGKWPQSKLRRSGQIIKN